MKMRILLLLGCSTLWGCQSIPVLDQPNYAVQNVESVKELSKQVLSLPSTTKINITPKSQKLSNSSVAFLSIPSNRGPLTISLTSEISNKVYMPSVKIYSENYDLLKEYSSDIFVYKKPRLNKGNRLVATFDFYPIVNQNQFYMLIYTNDKDLKSTTSIIHPGRLDAEARGNYMPELKDIIVPHSQLGALEIDIAGKNDTVLFENNKSNKPETRSFYHRAIKQAVADNDIPKALSLLDEAKALGINDAQTVFVQAVNGK